MALYSQEQQTNYIPYSMVNSHRLCSFEKLSEFASNNPKSWSTTCVMNGKFKNVW